MSGRKAPRWIYPGREVLGEVDRSALLEALPEGLPSFVVTLDLDHRIRFVHRVGPGFDGIQLIGRPALDIVRPEDRDEVSGTLDAVIADGQKRSYTTRAVGVDRQLVFVVHVVPLRAGGEVAGLCLLAEDVGERQRTLRELHEAREVLAMAVEATGLGLWEHDLQTNEVSWSRRMYEILQTDRPLDPSEFEALLADPADIEVARANVDKLLREGHFASMVRLDLGGETRWVHTAGRLIRDEQGNPIRSVGGQLDVTELQAGAEKLARAERLAVIGELTAGVAHNFNNMLMALTPTLELIASDGDAQSRERAGQALDVTRRAAGLVGQLMAVAGTDARRPLEPVRLSAVAHEAVEICRRMFPRELHIDLIEPSGSDGIDEGFAGATEPAVIADEDRVMQVLMNLMLNARDALLERDPNAGDAPGRIAISVAPAPAHADGRPRVGVFVSDNGDGVRSDMESRLFEPFVSSKGALGTGLGLASCGAIARQFSGEMRYDRCPDLGGARFGLLLPVHEADAPVAPSSREGSANRGQPLQDMRILMVEDEPVIRESVATILERRGASVVATATVPATITWLEAEPRTVDAVLLDRSLPGESGAELLPRLRAELPDAVVLYFTGEPVSDAESQLVDGVIAKPVRTRELVGRLLDVVESSRR